MFAKIARNSTKIASSRKFSAAGETLEKTAFYDLHLSLGGKIVPFAGYSLPVQYDGLGVLKEHVHTRSATGSSLFDVSHMGQIKWHGKDALAFVEKMVVGDIASLKVGEAKLSLIMNEQGTIMDDTVITNAGDHLYMVVNGACKVIITTVLWVHTSHTEYTHLLRQNFLQHKDMDHFNQYIKSTGMDVQMEYLGDQQLLALQVQLHSILIALLDVGHDALVLLITRFGHNSHFPLSFLSNLFRRARAP